MTIFSTNFLRRTALAAAAVLLVPVAASANNGIAEDLARIEKVNMTGVAVKHLKTVISPPKDSELAVRLSRSWIDSQPKASGSAQWRCLAEALYFEARGESVKGQFAVAEVIRNRVNSTRYPSNYCAVINQGTGRKFQCQFTYTCDGHKEIIAEPRAFVRVAKVARLVLDGKAPELTDGATHYHTTAVRPRWSRVFARTAHIGVHYFYRQGVRTASN